MPSIERVHSSSEYIIRRIFPSRLSAHPAFMENVRAFEAIHLSI
jgi:hypothetical protein